MAKEMIAVMSRCVKTKKIFGIRFDTNNGKNWEAAWAFPLKEGADKREKLSCWDGKTRHVICANCGCEGDLDSPISEIRGAGNF